MKILVTGAGGQLGHDVVWALTRRNHGVIGSDIAPDAQGMPVPGTAYVRLDITDREAVQSAMEQIGPDAVIHCAAWTDVDGAETEENRAKADAVNHWGTKYIAEAAKAADARMMYISTDYVFSGQGTAPWKPDDRPCGPLNVYGQSKLAGEIAVANALEQFFIVRTAWLFGWNGKNFVKTMLEAARTHDAVRVVNDQIGTPTYTKDLARLLSHMIETDRYGCYHATNEGGFISWYDFAKEIYRQAGLNTAVIPVSTAEYGRSKAKRPFNSRLDQSKLQEAGFDPLPHWQDALRHYLREAEIINGADQSDV